MANVTVCDRCGKTIVRKKWGYIGALTYSHKFRTDYDLCIECLEDFDEFMKGPSNGETDTADETEE